MILPLYREPIQAQGPRCFKAAIAATTLAVAAVAVIFFRNIIICVTSLIFGAVVCLLPKQNKIMIPPIIQLLDTYQLPETNERIQGFNDEQLIELKNRIIAFIERSKVIPVSEDIRKRINDCSLSLHPFDNPHLSLDTKIRFTRLLNAHLISLNQQF